MTLFIPIGIYACINPTDCYPKESESREALKTWHFVPGLTLLFLLALRLFNRFAD